MRMMVVIMATLASPFTPLISVVLAAYLRSNACRTSSLAASMATSLPPKSSLYGGTAPSTYASRT